MKKINILIIITSLLLTSCWEQKEEILKKYYKTATVQSWSIFGSNNYIWYTDSFNNVQLAPKVWWKIISITKNVWDKVNIWEVIATLDSSEAKTWYSSSLDVISSLEDLKVKTSQMYDSQINVMEQKIASAKTWIDIASVWVSWSEAWKSDTKNITDNQIKTIESQILWANTQLQTAKLQLENTKNTLNWKENDIYINSKNAITNANILASNVVDFLDNLFWITWANKYKKESYDIYISARNTGLKNEIEDNFNSISIKLNELKNLPLTTNENIKIALEKYNDIFSNDIRNILKNAYSAMENSVESTNFTESLINSNKTKISSFQSQNEQVILTVSWNYFIWLKWSLDSINNFEKEKKWTIDLLTKQVELSEKQIETLNQTKSQIASEWNWQLTEIQTKSQIAKKQMELSQNWLNEAIAWMQALREQKSASLAEIDTQINQVASGKNDASVMIENWKIISLIKWIVTKKLNEVWNTIWAWMPILVVSSDDKIKIEIQLNEDVLNKVILLDKVKVEIEWVSEIKTWIITKILPVRDMITKKSSVEITLDNSKKDIKIGSFSKVYFDIKNENNWLIIPNFAIVSKYMIPQVFVIENKKAILKNIKIIKQNDNFSQIEWLNLNELIITEWKENLFDWEDL